MLYYINILFKKEKKYEKSIFVLAACAVVSAALVGCGSSSSPESQSVATSDNAVAQNKGGYRAVSF